MSFSLAVTRALLKFSKRSTTSVETLNAKIARHIPPAPVSKELHALCTVEEFTVNGFEVVRLTPRAGVSTSQLVYLHGGVYAYAIRDIHWSMLARLITQSGATVTVPKYGLIPEHTAAEAYELLDAVYANAVATHGDRVFLGGDSAGGGLALGFAERLRDAASALAQPAGVILFSPWLDVTMSNPGIPPVEPLDSMLAPPGLIAAGVMWAGGLNVRSPLVSPIFGELAGLPPVFTFQGGRDIFVADTITLTEKIRAAGGSAELAITPAGFHVFMGATWTPESKAVLARVADLLRAAA